MSDERLSYLIARYFQNLATEKEKDELMPLLEDPQNKEVIEEMMSHFWEESNSGTAIFSKEKSNEILNEILKDSSVSEPKIHNDRKWRWLYSAAAIFIVLLSSALIYRLAFQSTDSQHKPAKTYAKANITPGRNRAVLTLSNGSAVDLDSMKRGSLAQGNSIITSTGGQLLYQTDKNRAPEIAYNILTTPKGGQYQMTLSDGSRVWLNAASSIRFPVTFTGKQRPVEITGEAYFEVAKNPNQPFVVSLNGMEIKVLGTHFNVNGYPDEEGIKTTLLEGSVKISKGQATVVLAPGQQADLISSGKMSLLDDADIEKAVSWKDGYFHFNKSDLQTVMRELSRWYDIDIIYENPNRTSQYSFSGDVEKSLSLSAVLRILEKSNVHFRIEERRLIVTP